MEDHEQIELEEHISRPNVRHTRRRSVIVSSCICISIYILGFALACALSVSYIQLLPTDKNKDRPGQLFLVSFICSNIVLLFQVLLVVLGVINIILGRRYVVYICMYTDIYMSWFVYVITKIANMGIYHCQCCISIMVMHIHHNYMIMGKLCIQFCTVYYVL